MTRHYQNERQRGAALVIGMILLAIITLLAVVGMNVSNSELAAAVTEQLRLRAFNASESGVEHGVEGVFDIGTTAANETVDVVAPAAIVVAGAPTTDTFHLTSRYRGDSELADGFGKNYLSFHFSVISRGASARNTRADHHQGAYIINGTGGQQSFKALPLWAVPVPPTP